MICLNRNKNNYIIKYSDSAILGLLDKSQDTSEYHSEISKFVPWCDANKLTVNIRKTVERIR